jgi:hypothetical protein
MIFSNEREYITITFKIIMYYAQTIETTVIRYVNDLIWSCFFRAGGGDPPTPLNRAAVHT